MSDAKWTNGEIVSEFNGYYYDLHVYDEDGRYVDQFCMGVAEDMAPNAHLIAAVQDLYNILEQMQMMGMLTVGHDSGADHKRLCRDAALVMAKARGERDE